MTVVPRAPTHQKNAANEHMQQSPEQLQAGLGSPLWSPSRREGEWEGRLRSALRRSRLGLKHSSSPKQRLCGANRAPYMTRTS